MTLPEVHARFRTICKKQSLLLNIFWILLVFAGLSYAKDHFFPGNDTVFDYVAQMGFVLSSILMLAMGPLTMGRLYLLWKKLPPYKNLSGEELDLFTKFTLAYKKFFFANLFAVIIILALAGFALLEIPLR